MKNICVFCSSSSAIDKDFFDNCNNLVSIFARNGFNLVFGGGDVGLMGMVAKIFYENKNFITGIVPEKLYRKMSIFKNIDELIITKNMQERVSKMVEKSDAFLILPGGFGTLQELLDVIVLKQLDYIDKPIAIYNYKNFYEDLLKQFQKMFDNNFAKIVYNELYLFSENITEIYDYIINYKSFNISEEKWFC